MKHFFPEQMKWAKYKGKGNTHVSSVIILGPDQRKLERHPQPKAQFVCFVFISKINKITAVATWINENFQSHDEHRGFLCMGHPPLQKPSVYPPGLGQHEDSPQHQEVFSPLSFRWQLLWLDEPDSHLH